MHAEIRAAPINRKSREQRRNHGIREASVIGMCETFPQRAVDFRSVLRVYRVCRAERKVRREPGPSAAFAAAAAQRSRKPSRQTQKLECERARAAYLAHNVTRLAIRAECPQQSPNIIALSSREGEIERDAAQEGARRAAHAARGAAGAASAVAQVLASRLAVREEQPAGADQGALHPRRCRARQDHADGPVLRGERREAKAPRAFSRVHGRRA